jgi:MoaA/NifB/PqqE/SkfB family radical SAM enzyme
MRFNFEDIPILKGYDISTSESVEYAQNYVTSFESGHFISDKLVPMMGVFCPNKCNLNCLFCSSSANTPPYPSLSRSLLSQLVQECAEIGVKTIEIAAMGEPTLWKDLLFLSDLTSQNGMVLVFFSNGLVFADDQLCCQVHGMDSQAFIERLFNNNVSILLKKNSNRPEIYDFMADMNGAYQDSEVAFYKLMKRGFNASTPTRLGFACVIIKQNASQVIELWQWARENNIFPFVESLQRIGRADCESCYEGLCLWQSEILELYRSLADLDQREYGIFWMPQLPYAGFPCTVFDHLAIDNQGMVRPCFKFLLDEDICGCVHESSLQQVILSSSRLYEIRKRRLRDTFADICINRIPEGLEPGPKNSIVNTRAVR